jgi:pimeloyl-ACP methyl ester carboxylesterase
MSRLLLFAALAALPIAAERPRLPAAATAATPAVSPATAPGPAPESRPQGSPGSTAAPAPAKAAPATAGAFVTIYGNRIHYLDSGGTAPAVILVHGMGSDASDWAWNIPELSRSFRVIAVDLPGYGKSDKPLVNYRVGMWVDHLEAFLRELKIERVSLVGASLGGWVAAAFTLEHPHRVDRLVLVSSGGYSPLPGVGERELRLLNPSTRAQVRDLLEIGFHSPLFKTAAAVELVYTRRLSAGDGYTNERLTRSILFGEDVLDTRFGEIRVPTLIVWGREDRLTPLALVGERLHRDIGGSRLVVLDEAGHIPQVEQAKRFNEVVTEFLAEKR